MKALEKELSKFGKGQQYPIEDREAMEGRIIETWQYASPNNDILREAGCDLTINAIHSYIMHEAINEWLKLDVDHNTPVNMFVGEYVQLGGLEEHILEAKVKPVLFKDKTLRKWKHKNDTHERRVLMIILLCRMNDWVFDTRMVPFVNENLEALLLTNSK